VEQQVLTIDLIVYYFGSKLFGLYSQVVLCCKESSSTADVQWRCAGQHGVFPKSHGKNPGDG